MVQENTLNDKLIIICGPTCSGKSALAVSLAKKIDGEVVSADSVAIYKDLNIGSAKPTIEEMQGVKHHLIDIIEPTESFTVSDYEERALKAIEDIRSRGKRVIICGGTGFYINSVLYKMSYGGTATNLEARNKYYDLAEKFGKEYVYEILKKVDAESAEKLHYNDLVRVVRALEIFDATGIKKSSQNDDKIARFDYVSIMINKDRQLLYDRINRRVDIMLANGLIEEVKSLIDRGITLDNQCMQGIGYKEVYSAIKSGNFDELADLIKINSRHYAKRQITFFKSFENLKLLDDDSTENLTNAVLKML